VTIFGRKIDENRQLRLPVNWTRKGQPAESKRNESMCEVLAWMLNIANSNFSDVRASSPTVSHNYKLEDGTVRNNGIMGSFPF
jgi:hypothetical protein